DRNHGLVGEGCHQLNLLVSKWTRGATAQRDNADWFSFSKEWDAENGAIVANFLALYEFVFGINQNIGNMDDAVLEHDPPCNRRPASDFNWMARYELVPFARSSIGYIKMKYCAFRSA